MAARMKGLHGSDEEAPLLYVSLAGFGGGPASAPEVDAK